MTDEHALLTAMAADPADDTVRLAYADFIEEKGESERAEFVRLQVELGRIDLNDPARRPLVVRHVRFLQDRVPEWRAELPRLPGIEWGDFKRGLVEEVQATHEEPVIRHAEAIFAQPAVHVLRLTRLHGGRRLPELPQLERLRSLRIIAARAEEDALRPLLASPHLANLQVLDLHGNYLADAGAVELAAREWPALAELWLGSNRIGNAGARALAASRALAALRLIDLRGNRITDIGARSALQGRFKSALMM
jgi:uncharacterized protein (TIGR02996 family)